MKLWLLSSALPLSLAWPAPYNQSSVDSSTTIHQFSRRAAFPALYPWPGKLEKGGCDDHLDIINEAYDQAMEMTVQAQNALDMLMSTRPNSGSDASSDEFNRALKWDKYRNSVKDLFNIDVDPQKGPDDAAKGTIERAKNMYSLIRDNNAQPKSMDKDKPRLFCGENGLESLDEGEKMRESDKKAAGKYGAWVLPSYRPKGNKDDAKKISRKMVNKGKDFKGHDHPCTAGGDKALAYTLNKGNSIFICNGGMEKEATLVAPEEGKTMAKTLQKHRALSDTLLHEMFHLFEDIEDLRTVKFAHKSSDEPEWKDEDQKIPKRDEDPVYGYLQSYQLAKYVPADALGTPETFVWFAISVFNEDWKFEGKDGVAKKMEWKK